MQTQSTVTELALNPLRNTQPMELVVYKIGSNPLIEFPGVTYNSGGSVHHPLRSAESSEIKRSTTLLHRLQNNYS